MGAAQTACCAKEEGQAIIQDETEITEVVKDEQEEDTDQRQKEKEAEEQERLRLIEEENQRKIEEDERIALQERAEAEEAKRRGDEEEARKHQEAAEAAEREAQALKELEQAELETRLKDEADGRRNKVNEWLKKNKFAGANEIKKTSCMGASTYPIHNAAVEGDVEIVKGLLEAKASPASKNSKGKTAEQMAQLKNNVDVVALLQAP